MDKKTAELSNLHSKEILVRRMFFAIGSSIIVHFLLMSGVILTTNLDITHPLEWIKNTWNIVTCLRMWIYFFIFSVVVFFLGVVCCKNYLNPAKYSSSRFIKFYHFFTSQNFIMGGLYLLLGGVLSWLRLSVEEGKFGSLIKNCERLDNYCLVEDYYFLLLEGFWIGGYFFVTSNYIRFHNLQFPIIPQSKIIQVKRGIKDIIGSTVFDGLWPVLYFFGFYGSFGSYCRNFISIPFSLSLEEIPLDKFSRLLNTSLFFYSWLHAVLFILIIQSMHLFFQAHLTEWIQFDIETTTTTTTALQFPEQINISLSDALSMEKIPILQQLGYLDLITVAQKDKLRRSKLFTLSQPGGHPYNWNRVVEKSLSLMKKFSDGLNSACSSQKEEVSVINTTLSLFGTSQLPEKNYSYQMRSLLPTDISKTDSTHQRHKIDNKVEPTQNILVQNYKNLKKTVINYLLSKKLISYIFSEQFENKIRYVLNDAQAVIWASDAISSLAALSLTEDPYGIVQKNLREIIETLLKLKQSLDKLQKLNLSMRKPMSDDRFMKQTLTALRSAIKRSLYRIVSHFKNYIKDLELTPATLDQLQQFSSFKE